MEVKPGYKQSEVGVIPEEWGTVTLDRASLPGGLVRGPFGGALKKEVFVRDGKKVYEQRNAIYRDATIGSYFINEAKYRELRRFAVAPGNFIVSCSGTIGRIFRIPKEAAPGVINQALLKIETNDEVVDPDYFFHYFAWEEFQRRIIDNTHGGAMQNLVGMSVFRTVDFAHPPLPEQHAIAEALGDVDALLGALEKLIAKKRDLKQAVMQQLLTGQTRLPGFTGDWDTPLLGDLFTFKNGLNKAKEFFGYGTPIVNYMDVYGKRGLCESDLHGRVSLSREELRAFEVRKGDVFFTRTSETADEVGITSVMLDEPQDTVFSGFVLRARPKDDSLDEQFKKYCFSTSSVRGQITSQSTETTRALTNGRYLSAVAIARPPKPEQTAIAGVLSDMDAELAALEQRLAKTRALKQGMMQELLTGRTRLV